MKYQKGKHSGYKHTKNISKKNKKSKILLRLFATVIITICIYFGYRLILIQKNKSIYNMIKKNTDYSSNISMNVQKVKELQKQNNDVKGWIQIENTNVNYPLLQTIDNSYYLKHDYKKKANKYGSIFINSKSNLMDNNSNVIIYGHNLKDTQMFNSLLKYENKDYYNQHKIIKVSNENEEYNYSIIAVFKSRIFYQDEEKVFRYYSYTYFENENKYNEYINKCKELQLYDAGESAQYGEQLITLITCEYSQENGRFIVVAKKIENKK